MCVCVYVCWVSATKISHVVDKLCSSIKYPDSFRPPVVCEGTEDSYLFLKTDSAHVRYSLDSPGEREREREINYNSLPGGIINLQSDRLGYLN